MSIGIVVRLPDGAFLAIDSRQRNAIGDPNFQDIPDKLVSITDSIYAVQLGAVSATHDAINRLKGEDLASLSPRAVSFAVQAATARSWESLTQSIDLPWPSLPLVAIIMVGGLAQDQPVVAGSFVTSFTEERFIPRFSIDKDWGFALFGGEKNGDHYAHFKEGIDHLPEWEDKRGPINEAITGLQKLTFDTFKEAAKTTPGIGGPITYTVIRRGFPVYTDIVGVI